MNKLPVLFVSCNVETLRAHQGGSGLARIIWGKHYDSVLLISSGEGIREPEILRLAGRGTDALLMQTLLQEQGFAPGIFSPVSSERRQLLRALLSDAPGELTELRLNTGMAESDYRRIGQSLETLREQSVLVICLDDTADLAGGGSISLHDRQLRELLHGWAEDQQWSSAMSGAEFRAGTRAKTDSRSLEDPTVCILTTAFSLGGSQIPQRMFGSYLNDAKQTLSGYGWMH